jgi:hypothetical protein
MDTSKLTPLEQEYVATLPPLEQKGLAIAVDHLGTSFSLKDSIGFMKFVKAKQGGGGG